MPNRAENQIEIYQSDLESTEELRDQNFQALAWAIAENRFLRSVLVGLSSKPLSSILLEGKGMIEENYQALQKDMGADIEAVIEMLVKRERYGGV